MRFWGKLLGKYINIKLSNHLEEKIYFFKAIFNRLSLFIKCAFLDYPYDFKSLGLVITLLNYTTSFVGVVCTHLK